MKFRWLFFFFPCLYLAGCVTSPSMDQYPVLEIRDGGIKMPEEDMATKLLPCGDGCAVLVRSPFK